MKHGGRTKQSGIYRWAAVLLSFMLLGGIGLPTVRTAFALDSVPLCGLAEHSHTSACYDMELICTAGSDGSAEQASCALQAHIHADVCYAEIPVLVCEDAAHMHGDDCYEQQRTLQCAVAEHMHGSGCLLPMEAAQTAEHTHTDACYREILRCGLTEHLHTEACLSDSAADIEQPSDWEASLPAIDAAESAKEALARIAESQLGYSESTKNFRIDEDGGRQGYTRYGAWYGDPYGAWNGMFAAFCLYYAGVPADIVPHCADVAEMLSQSAVLPVHDGVPQRGMLLFYMDAAGDYAVGIVTEADEEQLVLLAGDREGTAAQVILSIDDESIRGCADPDAENRQADPLTEIPVLTVPDLQLQPLDLSSRAAVKAEKDNTDMLERLRCADTREFITLNLYNYGDNINDKYRTDSKYPGFQQEYGTSSGAKVSDSNFGSNITADLNAGINGLTNAGSGINKVTDKANSPISKVEKVMYPTLKDGYPALADGTSLGYLFGADSSYGKRQNERNISGLFRYSEATGAYTYNSRENHAQFDPDTDTFRVYRQMLTPNMTMYPFGNFLPFNDIVHDAKRVSEIDRAYLASVAAAAQARQDAGESVYNNEYQTLSNALTTWIGAMDTAYSSGWDAVDAINAYFNAVVGSGFDFSNQTALLEKLYCLDYDVPTDFYFGLEMSMSFMQPRGGLTGADGAQPMRFYFTGDDDVWVYVDDVLFLDLSGIHRHVGGEIDFESGTVRYYSLDPSYGDVSDTPWREVSFSEILGTSDGLNAAGTFPNYSVHDLRFYYMERGSGSGVCCLNFNMPLLRENSISITKELTAEDGSTELLGDPDFLFQVLREDGEQFLSEGTQYTVTDAAGSTLDTRAVDTDGIIRLKAGQTAVIAGVAENAGRYFVRELLDADLFSQYGTVSVDGSTVTSDHYTHAVIGSDTFRGVDSTVKDASDGATVFRFENRVTPHKLGALEIEKVLETYAPTRAVSKFSFRVLLDTVPIDVGTEYTVTAADGTVQRRSAEKAGMISLSAGETARLENILAGTRFIVEEVGAKEAGYTVRYVVDGGAAADGYASGTIGMDTTVHTVVTNTEHGASIRIPVEKSLTVDDGMDTPFSVRLVQLADMESGAVLPNGEEQSLSVSAGSVGEFLLGYAEPMLPVLPAVFCYRIAEELPVESDGYRYDTSVYCVEVTVDRDAEGEIIASVTGVWKDGVPCDAGDSIVFQNTRLAQMCVEKTVQGASVGTEEAFEFELQLSVNGIPWQIACQAETAEGIEQLPFDSEGKLRFSLRAGEKICLSELPYGAAWTLTELHAAGFKVSIRTDDADPLVGNAVSGELTSDTVSVQVINASDYVLPSAGGVGTLPFYTLGSGLCLASVLAASKKKRKQNKRL